MWEGVMNVSTHVDMTLTVLSALGWRGNAKLAAKNAGYPDEVRAIEVDGIGAHVMGRNLASLAHFVVPQGDSGTFGGYCWHTDRSLPHLDLTKRSVKPNPGAWGFPVIESFLTREPLVVLINSMTQPGHQGSIEADQITYPAASSMADWAFQLYRVWAHDSRLERKQEALDTLAGWMMHLGVQDPSVPHHAGGVLLDGHSAFEGDVDECWNRIKADHTVDDLLTTLIQTDNCPATLTVRGLAEDRAKSAVISPRKLGWYRCFWRKGWNRQVKACVLRGLTGSVQLGKLLQREAK
jgi:hypothetical protein